MNNRLSNDQSLEQLIRFPIQFDGEIIFPDQSQYDSARSIWNGTVDKHPALIVRPNNTDAVATAVGFARRMNLSISVRGGGHNMNGFATNDDGIVIDMSAMNQVHVDPFARTVRVGGGATWVDVDAATQRYGLAVPGGTVSSIGVAGFTLGGGLGWLRNKYGLTCDNLISAETVTASGDIVYASDKVNPDLMWGLRGGGGNFGIVTCFEFELFPVGPNVMFAMIFHDASTPEAMEQAVRFYRDYCATAPDEVSTLLMLGNTLPAEQFGEDLHSKPFVLFCAMYAGEPADGKHALMPLREFAEPLLDLSGVMTYTDAQKILDTSYPRGMRYYWHSLNLVSLDDDAIKMMVGHTFQHPSAQCTTHIWHISGALKQAKRDAAWHGRHADFLLRASASWQETADDETNIAWTRGLIARMEPFSDGSRYLNFAEVQQEGDDTVSHAYGEKYPRLQALKWKYDPINVFSHNHNINPAS